MISKAMMALRLLCIVLSPEYVTHHSLSVHPLTYCFQILEQVEGGDLVVNKGNEARPKDQPGHMRRELNAVEGFETALKLSRVRIQQSRCIAHRQLCLSRQTLTTLINLV